MQLVDSHCHLDFPDFDPDREEILQQCRRLGINRIVIPGVRRQTWPGLLQLCERHPGLYPALGLHPLFLHHHQPGDPSLLDQELRRHWVVAIGEIGLDFYHNRDTAATQIDLFTRQLQIAASHQLPVLLHVRKAHDDVLRLLKRYPVVGGICHAFNGSLRQADTYISLGFKLGFGGMLTYTRSTRLRTLAATLPLTAIVLETDAPDMSPFHCRGQRNSPTSISAIASSLAEIRNCPLGEVAARTTANLIDCLNIPDAKPQYAQSLR